MHVHADNVNNKQSVLMLRVHTTSSLAIDKYGTGARRLWDLGNTPTRQVQMMLAWHPDTLEGATTT